MAIYIIMNSVNSDQINSLLPQTQCTKCGFNGCKPYAEAIATQEAEINRCSPGGEETIQAIASLLHQPIIPIAPDVLPTIPASQAFIDEERCIGCALCLKACPVDAILGARKLMHTVITDWCTGCELCIAPCPVDCISLVSKPDFAISPSATENRERYEHHQQHFSVVPKRSQTTSVDKQAMLKAALERAKNKKG